MSRVSGRNYDGRKNERLARLFVVLKDSPSLKSARGSNSTLFLAFLELQQSGLGDRVYLNSLGTFGKRYCKICSVRGQTEDGFNWLYILCKYPDAI